MTFENEKEFECALINILKTKGWEENVIKYPTEKDLINNWANILFENNREIDRLNNYPLTDGEMDQILEQVNKLQTPLKLNSFINGKTVTIKRDNPNDIEHLGKEISLKIYDRQEIAAGQSRYQIVQQPIFSKKLKMLNDRRGDLMLLINGMPVMHIELKRSGVSVREAYKQIEKYSHEGIFTGLFSLVQVFVAMTPDETVYFANPGTENEFSEDYYFHWADFNNERINDWKNVASSLLSILIVHKLIGFYTVADNLDGVLKVMKSYQYYAANAISDKVSKTNWKEKNLLGGYIWHTTGSGKTMTSFKSAQLIATSKDADKVVFLMGRIELGTQSLIEYRGFAEEGEDIQDTESTYELITKLKSTNPSDTLIVTSIQKMSRIKEDGLHKNEEGEESSVPFNLDGYITSIDTGRIDADYMNTKFEKYLKALKQDNINEEEPEKTLNELYKSYSSLSQKEQKYAQIFINDIQRGEVKIEKGKTFREYITQYLYESENNKIKKVSNILGLDEEKLRNIINLKVDKNNINAFGRFDELLKTVNLNMAKSYFEKISNQKLTMFDVNIEVYQFLRKFILNSEFDIDNYKLNIK